MALDISVKIDIEIFKKKNTGIPSPNSIPKKKISPRNTEIGPRMEWSILQDILQLNAMQMVRINIQTQQNNSC